MYIGCIKLVQLLDVFVTAPLKKTSLLVRAYIINLFNSTILFLNVYFQILFFLIYQYDNIELTDTHFDKQHNIIGFDKGDAWSTN